MTGPWMGSIDGGDWCAPNDAPIVFVVRLYLSIFRCFYWFAAGPFVHTIVARVDAKDPVADQSKCL